MFIMCECKCEHKKYTNLESTRVILLNKKITNEYNLDSRSLYMHVVSSLLLLLLLLNMKTNKQALILFAYS